MLFDMAMTTIVTRPRSSARTALREATSSQHAALEATMPMRRLLASGVTYNDVAAAIAAQLPTLESAEAALDGRADSIPSYFRCYRRRVPLALESLAVLGVEIARNLPRTGFAPREEQKCELPLDQGSFQRARQSGLAAQLGHGDGWLGFRYVVEGVSLGGAVIERHLGAHLPALPKLRFFDPNGHDRTAVWRSVCAMLEHELNEPARLASAIRGAVSAFEALIEAMDESAP